MTEQTRHIYKIDDGELHWFSARDESHAEDLYIEVYFGDDPEYYAGCTITQLDDDELLGITNDDGLYNETVYRSCAEWAKLSEGIIGSTCI